MSRTIGIFTESSDRNPEIDLCRLCREKHDCYYSIFTSNVACKITVKDALHDLVGLQVAVGDGLPTTMCPLFLKKLTEFSVFKKICLESNAILRKSLPRSCFRSFEGGGADNEESEPCVETKDCIQDVIENTSEFACSAQMTEVYIPVADCLLPRDDKLSFEREGAADDNLGPFVETKDCIQGAIENNSQPTCSAQTTEIYIPVPDCLLPRDDNSFHVKDESEDPLSEGSSLVLDTSHPAGISSDAVDPLATDDLPNALTASQGEKVEAQGTGAMEADRDWTLVGAKEELSPEENAQPTLSEDGDPFESSTTAHESAFGVPAAEEMPEQTTSTSYLLAEGYIRNHSIDECIGPTALVTQIDSKAGTSHEEIKKNLIDRDVEKCGASEPDEISSCSIPDDRQCNTKDIESLKSSRGGAAMAVVGEKSGCDAPNTSHSLRFIRISRNERSDSDTIMGGNEEIYNCLIINPGNSYSSNEDSYHCFYCSDVFKMKNELIRHMTIHSVAHNFDAAVESSIVDVSLGVHPSSGHSSSCEPTTSKALGGLDRKRLKPMPKENVLNKETRGGKGDETNTRLLTSRFTLEEKSTTQRLYSESSSIRIVRNHVGSREEERPYSCSECTESFTQKRDLTVHKLTHAGGKRYSCSTCSKSFTRRGHLDSHSRTHTAEKPFICKVCSKSFSRKGNLNAHVRTHTGERPFSCSECEKSFSDKRSLVRHVRTHTKEKMFSCNECEKSFSRKDVLYAHVRTHTGERPYSCNVCEKSFSDKSSLVRHVRTHTGEKTFSCSICEKYFTLKGNLKSHIRTHAGEKPFSCSECEKSFSDRSTLVRHVRTHTGEKTFSCRICEKSFTEKSHLDSHIRIHTGEKPFSCNECDKSFSSKSVLVRHVRRHTGEKPFSCSQCEKSFWSKGDLVGHVYTHTAEKPHSCGTCKKSFTLKGYLKSHMRMHTGEKPFKCNVCSKSFSRKHHLDAHLRTHTGERPFSCNECDKSFSDKSTLVRHIRTHTGVKPYSCSICRKCFTQRGNLKSHMRQHSRDKPYICNVCSKSFIQKSNLTSHIRTHVGRQTLFL